MAVTANRLLFLIFCGDIVLANERSVPKAHSIDEYNERQKLTKELLSNYDRSQIPARNSSKPVNVTITMWPYDILQVNEAKSSIRFSGWLDLRWIDYNMQWKPAAHANITHIFIPASQLWLPSVDIFYRKDDNDAKYCEDCYIKIDSNGETLMGQYFSFSFPCLINVKYFPFDMQFCEMELANWYLDDRLMDLYPRDSSVALDLSVFLPNVEWELINVTVTRKRQFFNYGYFPSLAYRLYIKRKPFFYVTVLVIPSLMITLTSVIGFHLPSSGCGLHQEKVQMGVTAVLSVFILQLGVADKLPPTSDVVPLIGIYYSCMVLILSLSIVSSAFIIVIEKQGIYGEPIPDWLQLIFLWRKRPKHHGKERKPPSPDVPCMVIENNNNNGRMIRQVSGHFSNHRVTIQDEHQPPHDWSESSVLSERSPVSCLRKTSALETPRVQQLQSSEQRKRSCMADVGNTKRKATTTKEQNSGGTPVDWAHSFRQTLAEIKASVAGLRRNQQEEERRAEIRRDWSTLADVVERISLAFFMSACFLSLFMFFNHGWY